VCCVQDYRDLKLLTSWQDQLYAAVCFSVINSVEKVSTRGSMRLGVYQAMQYGSCAVTGVHYMAGWCPKLCDRILER
jgi:hypothetical protein